MVEFLAGMELAAAPTFRLHEEWEDVAPERSRRNREPLGAAIRVRSPPAVNFFDPVFPNEEGPIDGNEVPSADWQMKR
jgi:hypothetical protein